ncbi:unnamed protein product [Urochloa humidicola]
MELNDAKRKQACPSTRSLAGELDRLSALPDCLLHSIMSLMKARQMVQTCVLSTRWRHLWRSAPCLNINFDEFRTSAGTATSSSGSGTNGDSYIDKVWEDFGDFAVNLMLHHSITVLDSFRLKAPVFDKREAGRWIRRAMKYRIPDPVIQREGLSSSSWCLKKLHLCNVCLYDPFAKHVSSVCHSLEDLELDACMCQNTHSIASHSLKKLVLKNCDLGKLSEITSPTLKTLIIDGGWIHTASPLVILAPILAYLHLALDVVFFDLISINEMPCLAKAFIHTSGITDNTVESKFSGNLLKLVCGVSNVESLELKGFGRMLFGEGSTPFQEFRNLRNLLLDQCVLTDDFQILGPFLQNSPNLEKLTLQHCQFLYEKKNEAQEPNKPTSSHCQSLDVQCENLKLTEIIYKYGSGNARQLVKLLGRISGKVPKNHIKVTKVD